MLLSSLQNSRAFRPAFAAALLLLSLAAAAPTARAQSGDANYPTPVFSNEVSGRIAPRDVGDARRTRHFYAFRGAEGDLSVTVETNQLIGDVDVFTATTFRPLVKFTLFGDPARLTKSFYVRRDEAFVLRVEARAVGDLEGTYTVRFGGSFTPAPAEMANVEAPAAPTLSPASPRDRNTRRVTATGARIEEPRPEPAPAEEARTEPSEARPAAPTPERAPARRGSASSSRRGRAARNPPARTRPPATAANPEAGRPETTDARPAEEASSGSTAEAAPAPAPRRRAPRPPRRGSASRPPAESAAQPAATPAAPPAPTQRLIIITRGGELFERDMGDVRRVTIENNQVVIVGRDGKVTRRPLADVLKMSIEP
ncbi:MAG TPA: hypothetical protein VF668_22630 [Pyrinomonadaceae bacterium]|jgi:hypothetical protein